MEAILGKTFKFSGQKFMVINDNRKPQFCYGSGTVTIKYQDGEQTLSGDDWNFNRPNMKQLTNKTNKEKKQCQLKQQKSVAK